MKKSNEQSVDSITALDQIGHEQLDLSVIPQIEYRSRALSSTTKQSYQATGSHFNNYLKKSGRRLNDETIKSYFDQFAPSWSHSTFNQKRQSLITIFKNQPGIKENAILIVAVEKLFRQIGKKKLEHSVKDDHYLEKAEIDQLIEHSESRIALMIKFLFGTGCRVSEMINIRLIDCQRNGQVAIKILGKGSKVRTVYISQSLFDAIRFTFHGKVYLFETGTGKRFRRENLFRYMRRAGKQAGIEKPVGNHIFRHSLAMYLLKIGKDIRQVSKYLGHSKISVTIEFYLHNSLGSEITECFNF